MRPQQDLVTAAWRKLMLNAAVNPLTGLTLRRMEVMGDGMILELAEGLMRETQVVRWSGTPRSRGRASRPCLSDQPDSERRC
ncbi:ketopantoate reductase family protein [Streptomyces sp. NPDC051913]|uniref:ketopantoate reductase family protein n=1 Tax=Streptomyces sp. NPDC051913 TaxID=3365676 RepID=UPI0037D7AAEA